jgi:5-methylcytosine-specific restriction endonuclease McrA
MNKTTKNWWEARHAAVAVTRVCLRSVLTLLRSGRRPMMTTAARVAALQAGPGIFHWTDQAITIADRDGCHCAYCKADLFVDWRSFRNWVLDHVVPKSKGGSLENDNVVNACRHCNEIKGTYDPRSLYLMPAPRDGYAFQSALDAMASSHESLVVAARKEIARRTAAQDARVAQKRAVWEANTSVSHP